MKDDLIERLNENEALRDRMAEYGLKADDICETDPADPESANRRLRSLLQWVRAYRDCPDRGGMERMGFLYPPVYPGMDPDNDWLMFERWMRGEPLAWRLNPEEISLADPQGLSDDELDKRLEALAALLESRGVVLDVQEGVPSRLICAYLRERLAEMRFEYLAPGTTWHLTGCDGCCPECFQRPWCDTGRESNWAEDEEAGEMVVPESVRAYVGPGPVPSPPPETEEQP